MQDFTAALKDGADIDRIATWREILGSTQVILKSPFPSLANLPGKPEAMIYELDLDALTDDQLERLCSVLARRFGISEEAVVKDMGLIGCPVLAEDVIVTVHNPQKWF